MQGVCKGAGAAVLELVLPEEEDDDAQQENTNPNGSGLMPKQEVSICSAVCLLQVCEGILWLLFSTPRTCMRQLILFCLGDLQSSEGMTILYLAGLAEIVCCLWADYRAVYICFGTQPLGQTCFVRHVQRCAQ